jgi:ribonuclease T1
MIDCEKRRSAVKVGCWLVALALALSPLACYGKETQRSEIAAQALPQDARDTLARIHAGGPFPYERDGVVVGHRERLLPPQPRGYYHEYTVATPGARGRGARRIVCGRHAAELSECYYSDDHYRSFRKIQP